MLCNKAPLGSNKAPLGSKPSPFIMLRLFPLLLSLLLLLLLPPLIPAPEVKSDEGGVTWWRGRREAQGPPSQGTDGQQPYFDSSMPSHVTAYTGKVAVLHCRVHASVNKSIIHQVSWIRKSDLHILTIGRYTYTSDQRFESKHHQGTNQWALIIHSVQPQDEGEYECQINSQRLKIFPVYLEVLVPSVRILEPESVFVEKGSMINLTCVVYNLPVPGSVVYWYHNEEMINYSSSRGGISLELEKGSNSTSRLLITHATAHDAGLYSCHPSQLSPVSVRVHVLDGELPAAMQNNNTAGYPPRGKGRVNSSSGSEKKTTHIAVTSVLLLPLLLPTWLEMLHVQSL